jgi:tellurite resistance protein TehA-like permease
VLGGALAITSLTGGQLFLTLSRLHLFPPVLPALRVLHLLTWGLALGLYVVLVVCEVLRPRFRYDVRRWATVFPLGMYAAATEGASRLLASDALEVTADAVFWLALGAWVVVTFWVVGRRAFPM